MIKQRVAFFRKMAIVLDAAVISAGFFIAAAGRIAAGGEPFSFQRFEQCVFVLVVVLPLYLGSLYYLGAYESFRTKRIATLILVVIHATLSSFFMFASVLFLLKESGISRLAATFGFAVSCVLLAVLKAGVILFFRFYRSKGYNYRSLLIIGTGSRAQRFIEHIRAQSSWGYRIAGLIDEDPAMAGQTVAGCPILGTFSDIDAIVRSMVIDEAVFVVPRSWLDRIDDVVANCERLGLKVHIAVDYFRSQFSRTKLEDLDGMPFVSFEDASDRFRYLVCKRTIDVVLSGISLVVLSPLCAAIALAIKGTSRGSVLFKQQRMGLHGRVFTLYKFRTMVMDAEERKSGLLALNEMEGPVFKLTRDPRVTVVGRFLRRLSLDELPQLWNIFKGDMSIVGPRPPLPSEVGEYDAWQRRRLSMRPGLTCLWQVSGRNRIREFDDWVKLDLKYIDEWSLGLDFRIIARTIPASLLGIGAK